jgi:hypothetical protein
MMSTGRNASRMFTTYGLPSGRTTSTGKIGRRVRGAAPIWGPKETISCFANGEGRSKVSLFLFLFPRVPLQMSLMHASISETCYWLIYSIGRILR